jgi:hypothetical protein
MEALPADMLAPDARIPMMMSFKPNDGKCHLIDSAHFMIRPQLSQLEPWLKKRSESGRNVEVAG